MNSPSTPPGLGLACKLCGWLFDGRLTMGVTAAHFDTEHDGADVRLELVVLCLRCTTPMAYERSHGLRDLFACRTCHRTRVIGRAA